MKKKFNLSPQEYKGIKLSLCARKYNYEKAKRYTLGKGQNIWIPNQYLQEDGTLKENINIDFVFRKSQRQLELAGYLDPIPGIKRRTTQEVKPSRSQLKLVDEILKPPYGV